MLTKKQHSAAARVLFTAYCRYRRSDIRAVAQERWIALRHSGESDLVGFIGTPQSRLGTIMELERKDRSPNLSLQEMAESPRVMLLPHFQAPEKALEFVFAHELAHDILNYSEIEVEETLFTQKPQEKLYTDAEWEFEYLCDAFAFNFVVYRAGVELLRPLQQDYAKAFEFDPVALKEARATDSWIPIHTHWVTAIRAHAKNMPDRHRIGMQTLAQMMLDY